MANFARRLKQLERYAKERAADPMSEYRGLSREQVFLKVQAILDRIDSELARREAEGLASGAKDYEK